MLRSRLTYRVRGLGQPGGGTGSAGFALSAPTLTRTSGVSTYPPTVDFTRPIDWTDGIQAVMQRSQDATFATGVTEAINTITAAVTTYNFGLSNILSGVWYWRMAAWSGTRPTSLNWSNIGAVGDTVAPTITSSSSISVAERNGSGVANKLAHSLTANEGVTWGISGTDASLLELAGSTIQLAANADLDYETKTSYAITATATDYAGNQSTPQTLTINVTDVNENPSTFTFTDVSGATVSTQYTSNTITLAGLPTGYAAPYSFSGSGTLYKNGVAGGTVGTCVNGDQFYIVLTSSSGYSTSLSGTLSIGGQASPLSDTYSVQTQPDPNVPFSLTEVATPAPAAGGSSATFSGLNFGTASATRRMIAVIDCYNAGFPIDGGVTIGGVAATQLHYTDNQLSVWIANVPTGTTGNVVVTAVAASFYILRLWRLDGASPTPTEIVEYAHNWDTSPWALFTVNTPSGGATLIACVAETTSGTASWTNATGVSQVTGGATTLATATRSTAGSAAVSINGFGGNYHDAIALGFAP